uniref:Putative secreted protein n=1 Tax=Anopheles darlingi TaxID=43151 RepID=A0A2M4DCG3_ANODA
MVALMMAIRAMIITAAAMDTIPAKRQRATNGGHLRPLLRQIATPTVVAIRRHRSMVVPRAQAQTIVNPILRWVVAHPDTARRRPLPLCHPTAARSPVTDPHHHPLVEGFECQIREGSLILRPP